MCGLAQKNKKYFTCTNGSRETRHFYLHNDFLKQNFYYFLLYLPWFTVYVGYIYINMLYIYVYVIVLLFCKDKGTKMCMFKNVHFKNMFLIHCGRYITCTCSTHTYMYLDPLCCFEPV